MIGELTLSELASSTTLTHTTSWKRQAKDCRVSAFSGAAAVKKDGEAELRDLHALIGQLTVEKDYLERAFARR
ncbi:MAG: hypothetical protein HY795_11650 [Desulfovibrio sp.]|nr:hypothetical protein [Desulfovibrio sp.]MBI4958960.1 hypothetical protein [Desulfovibrio sp.]